MDNAGHPPVWHRAGAFAFVGPDWTGEPAEVRAVRSNTPFVLAFLRILVNGEDDLPAVAALQQRFTVTTLPAGLGSPGAGGDAASLPTCDAADARGFFRTLRRLLALMPVPAGEAGVHAGFDPIGIGPGGSDKALDAVPARGPQGRPGTGQADRRSGWAPVRCAGQLLAHRPRRDRHLRLRLPAVAK